MAENRAKPSELRLLGRAIRQIRAEHDTSIEELAESTGVEPSCIRALEDGRLDPDYELLLALSEGLRVQPSTLVLRAEALGAAEKAHQT
jgi:transcriptional regulator with XRE-family HTH domain